MRIHPLQIPRVQNPTLLRLGVCLCLCLALTGRAATSFQRAETFDVLVRNGRVLDGAGNPWVRADIGIRGDRIVEVGNLAERAAGKVIDARGQIVSPGFIDMHSHSDFALLADGRGESKIRQGVTTDILGESGSAAPVFGPARQERIESIQPLELTLDWTTFSEYFDRLERQGISLNIASFVASGQIRSAVIGFDDRPATPEELARMKAEVRDAMSQGAIGLSSGLIYVPNRYMPTDELVELAREAAVRGGIYISHIRGEGQTLLEAVREAISIGEQARMPVEIFHFKATGPMRGRILEAARVIEDARARGVDVTADVYPYVASATALLSLTIPAWAQEGGRETLVGRLRDEPTRLRVHSEMNGNYENIRVASVQTAGNKKYEGMSIAGIAKDRNVSPQQAVTDLLLAEEGLVGGISFGMAEEDVEAALRLPWVSIGSDGTALRTDGVLGRGKPHPRSYGTHARVLGRYVREHKILSLEDAVRKMTSLPAARLGLHDRGLLRPGMIADIAIFDPDRVTDRATFENPHQYAEGVSHVLVSGTVVLEDGRHTGARPGKVLRGPAHRK